jgi:hypothetical protein
VGVLSAGGVERRHRAGGAAGALAEPGARTPRAATPKSQAEERRGENAMQTTDWTISSRRVAQVAPPLCVLLGVAAAMLTGGNGMACAVVGGALLHLAGFGAGFRLPEPVRVRAAHSAGGTR